MNWLKRSKVSSSNTDVRVNEGTLQRTTGLAYSNHSLTEKDKAFFRRINAESSKVAQEGSSEEYDKAVTG